MRNFSTLLGLALSATVLILSGCHSDDPMDVSQDAILHNLTPELRTTVERPIDAKAHARVTHNLNSRMFYEDLGRALYTSHPSRLNPLPIINTSGQPR